jgi:two-component system response regulator NreC
MTSRHAPDTRQPLTIVLADDHTLVRTGLRLLLDSQDDMRVVGEAGDAATALEVVRETRPHVLVLDLNMPGLLAPLEALARLRRDKSPPAVVVLTMQEDPAFARRALRAGAIAYVLKEEADADLVAAVRGAAAGRSYLTPRMGALVAALPPAPAPPPELTAREIEVLRLIALGHTNAEIGERLSLSIRTIESHRARIQHKLQRSTRAELVRYALDRELLEA